MKSPKEAMLNLMDEAGYVEEDTFLYFNVRELKDKFVFVYYNVDSDTYSVNEFFKPTVISSADYAGEPVMVTFELAHAIAAANNVI